MTFSKAGMLVALVGLWTSGCTRGETPGAKPESQMFDAPYSAFVADAGAHTAGCEVEITASGDGGERTDRMTTLLEVDERGNFRLAPEPGWEVIRVGSTSWQRPDDSEPFVRIESGARPELSRDAAALAWRPLLAPFRDRFSLEKSGTRKLGDRSIDVYTFTVKAGGGADGGIQVETGKGTVELDAVTGVPVGFNFEGSWNAPGPAPESGRVKFTADKLTCAVVDLGKVDEIKPPKTTSSGTAESE